MFRFKCQHCGVRVRLARQCSNCGGPQRARFLSGLPPLACLGMVAVVAVTSARILGGSAEAYRPTTSGSEMLTEEEVGVEREEVPWVFAKEMSAAVGREVDGFTRKEPFVDPED